VIDVRCTAPDSRFISRFWRETQEKFEKEKVLHVCWVDVLREPVRILQEMQIPSEEDFYCTLK